MGGKASPSQFFLLEAEAEILLTFSQNVQESRIEGANKNHPLPDPLLEPAGEILSVGTGL
jgi:hypothetical protein